MSDVLLPLGFTTRETGYWLGKPRPNRNNPKIIEQVKTRIVEDISRWLNNEVSFETIFSDLEDVVFLHDGYARARALEKKGYTPDTELVEILDEFDTYFYEEIKVAEKEWMRLNDNVLILEVGDAVSAETNKKFIAGAIIEVHADTGYYLICSEAEGHKKEGLGVHGVYVAFEKVTKVG
jgi:hypothetical protein